MYEIASLMHNGCPVGCRVFSVLDLSRAFDIDLEIVFQLSHSVPDDGKYIVLKDRDGLLISQQEYSGGLTVTDLSHNLKQARQLLGNLRGYYFSNEVINFTVPTSCVIGIQKSNSVPYLLDSTLKSIILCLLRGVNIRLIANLHDVSEKIVRSIEKESGIVSSFSKLSETQVKSLCTALSKSPKILSLSADYFVTLPVILYLAYKHGIIVSQNQVPLSFYDALRQGINMGMSTKELGKILGCPVSVINSLMRGYILDRDISFLSVELKEKIKNDLLSGLSINVISKVTGTDRQLILRLAKITGIPISKTKLLSTPEEVKNAFFSLPSLGTIVNKSDMTLSEVRKIASDYNIVCSRSELTEELEEKIVEDILKKVKSENIALSHNVALGVVKDVYASFKESRSEGKVWLTKTKKKSILADLFSIPVFTTIATENNTSDKTVLKVAEEFGVVTSENALTVKETTSLLVSIQRGDSLESISKAHNVSARVVQHLKNEVTTDEMKKDLLSGSTVYDVSFKYSTPVGIVKKLSEEIIGR